MADKKKMSVDEVLAACRRNDRPGNDSNATSAPAEADPASPAADPAATGEPAAAPPEAASPKAVKPAKAAKAPAAPATGKKPSEMSVADILAAARAGKSAGGAADSAGDASAAADDEAAVPAKPAANKPAVSKPAAAGGKMSVNDILAAARAGKGAAPAEPTATKPAAAAPGKEGPAKGGPAKEKPAPKPAPAKAEKSAAGATTAKDTTSILAAARKSAKPGPMSKAEAEAKGKPVEEKAGKKKLEAPPMPPKPDYARPTAVAATPQETRRSFFGAVTAVFVGSSLAVGFSSLAVTHLLWVLGLARFMFPNVLTEPPTRFKVGTPDDYAPGQVENKYKAQFGVWVVRAEYEGQPQIFALQSVCTHLGCTPNWLEGEQKFKCPCHGSGFYKDGVNFEGPAPRPLERFAIRLADDGQLEVDKSRKFQEELGQWKDPSCYVTT